MGAVTINQEQGKVESTGRREDFYIFGGGYFQLRQGSDTLFTRNGAFSLDATGRLATPTGAILRGYGVDEDFQIVDSQIVDLTIPFSATFGEATTTVTYGGSLNPTAQIATQATIRRSEPTSATSLADSLGGITIGGLSLVNDGSGGFTSPVEVIYSPRKVGRSVAPATITLSPADPLSRLTSFITGSLEISESIAQPAGNAPGASLDGAGRIGITGNLGSLSGFDVQEGDFEVRRASDGALGQIRLNLADLVQSATGESAIASNTVYDSNGDAVTLDATIYLESVDAEGSVWRVLAASPDQSDGPDSTARAVGSSQLRFDTLGRLASVRDASFSIELADRGAESPLVVATDYSSLFGLNTGRSSLQLLSQDGIPEGNLVDFGLGEDGVLNGIFSNGSSRPLGQILLARFDNPSGLIAEAQGIYRQGFASGQPVLRTPGDGVGTTGNSGLEASTVDVAEQLVGLVSLSTGFAANSRSFATSQELLQQFTALLRS